MELIQINIKNKIKIMIKTSKNKSVVLGKAKVRVVKNKLQVMIPKKVLAKGPKNPIVSITANIKSLKTTDLKNIKKSNLYEVSLVKVPKAIKKEIIKKPKSKNK